DQRRSFCVDGPADPVLDLLGRMRLVEDITDEELREIRVVLQPVAMVELVPAFVAVALGRKMSSVESLIVRGSNGRDRTGEDGRPDPLGMNGRQGGGERGRAR